MRVIGGGAHEAVRKRSRQRSDDHDDRRDRDDDERHDDDYPCRTARPPAGAIAGAHAGVDLAGLLSHHRDDCMRSYAP